MPSLSPRSLPRSASACPFGKRKGVEGSSGLTPRLSCGCFSRNTRTPYVPSSRVYTSHSLHQTHGRISRSPLSNARPGGGVVRPLELYEVQQFGAPGTLYPPPPASSRGVARRYSRSHFLSHSRGIPGFHLDRAGLLDSLPSCVPHRVRVNRHRAGRRGGLTAVGEAVGIRSAEGSRSLEDHGGIAGACG